MSGARPSAVIAENRLPPLEFADYDTQAPLLPSAVLTEGQRVVVYCGLSVATQLVEQLQLRWLEDECATGTPTADQRAALLVCSKAEQRIHLKRAIEALNGPTTMHFELMVREKKELEDVLTTVTQQLASAEATFAATARTSQEALHFFGEPVFTTTAGAATASQTVATSFEVCRKQLKDVAAVLAEAAKASQRAAEQLAVEHRNTQAFASLPVWRQTPSMTTSDDGPEEMESTDYTVLNLFQAEVQRKLDAVRMIIAFITKARRLMKQGKGMTSVVELMVNRLSEMEARPAALKQAEALITRRVVLQRAVRRVLLPLQQVRTELDADTQAFLHSKLAASLPEQVKRLLTCPVPAVSVVADPVVGTVEPHIPINLNVDEVEELLEAVGARWSSSQPAFFSVAGAHTHEAARHVEEDPSLTSEIGTSMAEEVRRLRSQLAAQSRELHECQERIRGLESSSTSKENET